MCTCRPFARVAVDRLDLSFQPRDFTPYGEWEVAPRCMCACALSLPAHNPRQALNSAWARFSHTKFILEHPLAPRLGNHTDVWLLSQTTLLLLPVQQRLLSHICPKRKVKVKESGFKGLCPPPLKWLIPHLLGHTCQRHSVHIRSHNCTHDTYGTVRNWQRLTGWCATECKQESIHVGEIQLAGGHW